MSSVAVIPARGGSKRIPRKNIRLFCGKPMIAWSIIAARESGCFERIIVSTDDKEIAATAAEWGAEVPFTRPAELADDHAGTVPVIRHAVEQLSASGRPPGQVCCIYATAPFVTPDDLRRGHRQLEAEGCEYAFSVTTFPSPIQRALRITAGGRVEMFHPEYLEKRSQDLEEAYHDAGQFYWGKVDAWLRELPLFGDHAAPVILPRYRVQDIDTPEDWHTAETLFQALNTG